MHRGRGGEGAVEQAADRSPTLAFPSIRRDALLLGAAALVLYTLTLFPDLAGGDSGELTTAVATGGVIHPPGYPLYALLGKLFVHLPHGSIAWRMNFLSAVCDAALMTSLA